MTSQEDEWDETMAKTSTLLGRSRELVDQAILVRERHEQWERSYGITNEIKEKFFAGLNEHAAKKAQEDREEFARQMKHDLGDEVALGAFQPSKKQRRRIRDTV